MTTMTMTITQSLPGGLDPEHYAGRADAYDDHAHMTIESLSVRASYLLDLHPSLAYAQGYSAYVKGAQVEEQRISGRTEVA